MEQRNHKKTTIKIDGVKLKALLENKSGEDIYTIAKNNGFSKNLIAEACRTGYASAIIQNIARLYGIGPDDYKVEEITPQKDEQLSINDYIFITPEEIKKAVKDGVTEAIIETVPDIVKGIIDNLPEIIKEV